MQVTIGGEPRTLGDFSAYKAFKAMEVIADVEAVWREVLTEAARFKRSYEAEHFVEMDRATARREFRPRPLWETLNDGENVIERPVLQDGQPVIGPDPLGHLTEADWEASGQKLRLPDSPSEQLQTAAMIPTAFRLGRDQCLKLMAIATVSNADIERWDDVSAENVDDELDKAAHELLHRCKADELLKLAAAAFELFKEQVSGPFEDLVAAVRTTFEKPETEGDQEATTPAAMQVETEGDDTTGSTPGSRTSSLDSADGSGGTRAPSPTALASASSSGSESG